MTQPRCEVIGDCTLWLGDAMEILPTLGTVDAIIADAPYYRLVDEAWDKQWPTPEAFLTWVDTMLTVCSPHLAQNASLYWFCSSQMAGRIEGVLHKHLHVLNHLVWDKQGTRKGVGGSGIDVPALRKYWSAQNERILFAEPWAEAELNIEHTAYGRACRGAKTSVIGQYLTAEFARANVSASQIAALFPSKTGQRTGCVRNWLLGYNLPTPEQYDTMRRFLNAPDSDDFLRQEYHDLRQEYHDLRQEYHDLRRPFTASAAGEWGEVWRFPVVQQAIHPAQKPLELLCHMLEVSTRTGALVCDPFAGVGSTAVACVMRGRRFVGCELDPHYFDLACRRIEAAYKQPDLFVPPPRVVAPVQLGLRAQKETTP